MAHMKQEGAVCRLASVAIRQPSQSPELAPASHIAAAPTRRARHRPSRRRRLRRRPSRPTRRRRTGPSFRRSGALDRVLMASLSYMQDSAKCGLLCRHLNLQQQASTGTTARRRQNEPLPGCLHHALGRRLGGYNASCPASSCGTPTLHIGEIKVCSAQASH
jgi:hypothetical protein